MKSYRLMFLWALLLPVFSFAQSNYKPGVAVTLNGDTLRGSIEYHDWESEPRSIHFKKADGSIVKLGANDIKYFALNTDRLVEYQRYAGHISMNQTNISQMQNGRDTSSRTDTIFLRVLQEGKKVTLLSNTDAFKTRFFIKETSAGEIKELIYRVYYNHDEQGGGDTHTVYDNIYQKQLYQLAQKFNQADDALNSYILKSEYREDNLLVIAGKINNISATDAKKNNPSKAKPIRIAGAVLLSAAVIIFFIHEFAGQNK